MRLEPTPLHVDAGTHDEVLDQHRAVAAAGRLSAEQAAELVFTALGTASACWSTLQGAGVFESDRAAATGRELLTALGYEIPAGYRHHPSPEAEAAPVEVSPPMARLMARIRTTHQAVIYDAHDRHTDMIEAAARAAGLVPVPSTTVQPRTIRGCPLPPGVTPPALDPGPAVESALAALMDAARPILASVHAGGRAAGRAGAVVERSYGR